MTLGLIGEGLTDQLVKRSIINAVVNKDSERALVTDLCPMDDAPTGYTKVFDYIKGEDFRNAFGDAEFHAVIHVDTDTVDRWPEFFKNDAAALTIIKGIPNTANGDEANVKMVVDQVVLLFRHLIGDAFFDAHQQRIIPAVAVNEIECWVLVYQAQTESDKAKVVNCLNSLNKVLSKQGFTIDPEKKGGENFRYYRTAIKPMAKNKTLIERHEHNHSLRLFIERLQQIP